MKKPEWLRIPYIDNENTRYVTELLSELGLNTVCIEANCPNCSECFSNKTATFMILGTVCTRNCAFCNVSSGIPSQVDSDEPRRIAHAVEKLSLKYAVITSVTRDDLSDGGASHFSEVIKAIKETSPDTLVEVLIPDLKDIKVIAAQSPAVISHNIETVKSLYPSVRPEADYITSLNVIGSIKRFNPGICAKSGLMLGFGETKDEILETFSDLLDAGCELLTIGQYLPPGKNNYPVHEYIKPQLFSEYREIALQMGFKHVASAPLVRSSYKAENFLKYKH